MKNAFSDKASIIARQMLADPGRKWVLRDFGGSSGLSLGMAQGVLAALQDMGCLERVKKGPYSYARLVDAELLVSEWVKAYKFSMNAVYTYYTPHGDFLKRLKAAVPADKYALTLHSGANLETGFVKIDDSYIYLCLENWQQELPRLRERLELKKLAQGGNVHLVRPFYKSVIFSAHREVKGFSVVSDLQLYLDLYNFQPRGREHAQYLKETLLRKGEQLA
ncbi:MAG: type IV toxin-antitoxin system AbiEi family antitoxin [Nitrospiraceae bacterium]|nr:type IV toxin-antitoxin system AbiEi family antitoxin [Nitrospiraceae bacterium]